MLLLCYKLKSLKCACRRSENIPRFKIFKLTCRDKAYENRDNENTDTHGAIIKKGH